MSSIFCFHNGARLRAVYPISKILGVPIPGKQLCVHKATPASLSPTSTPPRRRALHSSTRLSRPISRSGIPPATMPQQTRASSSSSPAAAAAAAAAKKPTPPSKKTPPVPRPSASIILLSPNNEVLLLHRVQTSTSFPSAHVFPGGNLSPFHEGPLPAPDQPEHHRDSPAYRLAAIRETFEESGILLARPLATTTTTSSSSSSSQQQQQHQLVTLPDPSAARRAVHADELRFADCLAGAGAAPATDELVPFTRWISPAGAKGPRRFSTQMYLFLMPLSSAAASSLPPSRPGEEIVVEVHQTPTSDGGLEHTAAAFAAPREWLRRQEAGEIVLFPPQCFLLTMVARALEGAGAGADYAAQRRALLDFVTKVPPPPEEELESRAGGGRGRNKAHPTSLIPWADKVMSPEVLFVRRSDGKLVLGIDKPGAELKGTGRGGDFERVVLARFGKEGPRDLEVRNREDVLREEKEAEVREQSDENRRSKI